MGSGVSAESQRVVLSWIRMIHLVNIGTQLANKSSRELHQELCIGQGIGKSHAGHGFNAIENWRDEQET